MPRRRRRRAAPGGQVPPELRLAYGARALTLGRAVFSLLPSPRHRESPCPACRGRVASGCLACRRWEHLLRDGDPVAYRRLITRAVCAIAADDLSAPPPPRYTPGNSGHSQARLVREMMKSIVADQSHGTKNVLCNGLHEGGQSICISDLVSSSSWSILLHRIGDLLMCYLLRSLVFHSMWFCEILYLQVLLRENINPKLQKQNVIQCCWLPKSIKNLIRNSKRCQYKKLFLKHCSVKCKVAPDVTKNDGKAHYPPGGKAAYYDRSFSRLEAYSTHQQVASFVWAVLKRIVPKPLLGNSFGKRSLRTNIWKFIKLQRESKRYDVFYYPKSVWRDLTSNAIASLNKKNFRILRGEPRKAVRHLNCSSRVRFLPKAKDMRPLVNLRAKSKDANLNKCHLIMKKLRDEKPEMFGSSVFDYNNVHQNLSQFISSKRSQLMKKLKAFDCVSHDMVLKMIDDAFKCDEYTVRKCSKGTICRILKEQFHHLLYEQIKCNILKIGQKYYLQQVGIAQGSKLSPNLCSLYYGHLENSVLSKFLHDSKLNAGEAFSEPEYLLMRFIDDFIFISFSLEHAQKFLNRMRRGFVFYNCYMNDSKYGFNFCAGNSEPSSNRLYRGDDGVSFMPWSGLLINCETLEIQADYTRYMHSLIVRRMQDVELHYNVRPVLKLRRKETIWLGLTAYIRVLQQKQSRYKDMLTLLTAELGRYCHLGHECDTLRYAVDDSHSSMFWKFKF
uniref:Telomerase reverse transcriptase n=1 Tax=Oryza glumipatula TaxID=40148 RepID=A0A0E0BRK8_9ORYZ